jgi:hypothetical protein
MMRGSIIVLVAFFISCSTKERVPAGVLAKEEMVRVLTELYVGEEKINRMAVTRDSSEKVFSLLEGKIQQKTGIPDSVFKRSMNYYFDHPLEMELIYTALVDTLNLKEQRENVKHPKE